MADNYTLDGDNYTQEEVLEAAEAKGLTVENYISEYYPDDFKANQTDSLTETQMTGSSVQDRTAQSNIVVPEVIGDAPDFAMEDLMTEEESVEFDRRAEEQRRKGREGSKIYLRQKEIKDKTGLIPSQYPNLQVGTEKQSSMGQVVDVPIYEQVDLEKMEEITTDVTSEYRNVFNSLMSDELETLQNYAEDPMTYADELDKLHGQIFSTMQEKYPGLRERDFMKIVKQPGIRAGLFQTALNKVTAEDKERDNAENLLGATTLDEDVYKQIFNQTSQNFSREELEKQRLNTLIRNDQRELRTLENEGGDPVRINFLKSDIKKHKKDIQLLAQKRTQTYGEINPDDVYTDKKLASSYMDNETTEYRQGKIDQAKKDLDGSLSTQLQEQKIKNPKLTDFEAQKQLI